MKEETIIGKSEYLDLARLWVYQNYKTITAAAIGLGISRATLGTALQGKTPMPGVIRNALNCDENEPTYTKKG